MESFSSNEDIVEQNKDSVCLRKCTFVEYATRTKEGIKFFTAKEVSFSTGFHNEKVRFPSKNLNFPSVYASNLKSLSFNGSPNDSMLTSSFTRGSLLDQQTLAKSKPCVEPHENSMSLVPIRRKHFHPAKKIKVDVPYDHTTTNRNQSRKHTAPKSQTKTSKDKDSKILHWKQILMISLLPVVAIFGVAWLILPTYTENLEQQWNLQLLHNALKEKVFGQEEAISSLFQILLTFFNEVDEKTPMPMPIVLFSGSNGVGKTLVSSIIASSFPPPGKTELILFSPPPVGEIVLEKLRGSGPHLVVIDDLNYKFVEDTINWVKNFRNQAMWLNKSVIIFLIFNVQVWDENETTIEDNTFRDSMEKRGEELFLKFSSFGHSAHHVHFNPLRFDHVKNCVKVALRKRGLSDFAELQNYIDKISSRINYRRQGCKPVWSHTMSMD